MNFRQILVSQMNGVSTPADALVSPDFVRVREENKDGFTAIYVSAHVSAGIHGTAGIVLRPDLPNTGVHCLDIQQHSDFWCRPRFLGKLSDVYDFSEEILFTADEGKTFTAVLPVVDKTVRTVLCGYFGGVELRTFCALDGDTDLDEQLVCVIGSGKDPHDLLHDIAKAAADRLGKGLLMRDERKLPELFEYLGWCSWDALQIYVSHDGLMTKVNEFKEKKVPIHYAIIDDMWGDCPNLKTAPENSDSDENRSKMFGVMHQSKMNRFEGDPDRFPNGLAAAVKDMKECIPHVGIWFPTTGYWKGMIPDGPMAKDLDGILEMSAGGRYIVKPTPDCTEKFFDYTVGKCAEMGADFVKIDNQGMHKANYYGNYRIGESSAAIQSGIEKAVGKYMDNAIINCMGMPAECMFNRPTTPISRCSDDFQPENAAWFVKNILQCAYNGCLQGQYYINDWDMWWTDDGQAEKNSLCRALSGGPVYVSDKIGRTRAEILKPLCFDDGRLLRPEDSAMPTADCLTVDPTHSKAPMKIFNRVGTAGLVAAYNIDSHEDAVQGTVSPDDARLPAGEYVWYEYFTKQSGVIRAGEKLPVTLTGKDEYRLYTFTPKKAGVTPLGRCDKFIGIKALTEVSGNAVTLYEAGPCAFYCDADTTFTDECGNVLEKKTVGSVAFVTPKTEKVLF